MSTPPTASLPGLVSQSSRAPEIDPTARLLFIINAASGRNDSDTTRLRTVPVPVQVGLINERVFLVNASLGLYPEMLQDREAYKARFGRSRFVAFGSALITMLGRHRDLRLRIERWDYAATARAFVRTTVTEVNPGREQGVADER